MIESQNPEIDLLRLKQHIDRDMTSGRLDDPGSSISLDDTDIVTPLKRPERSSPPPYVTAPIQPGFVPDPRRRYRVHDLMAYHDAVFVSVAYLSILGRQPDPEGFAHYLGRLHAGDAKAEILGRMRNSEEGRAFGARVQGLALRFLLARVCRLPVIGKLAQILLAVWQLPASQRNQSQFQDYVVSVLGQVQENARAQSERLRAAIDVLGADQAAIFEHFEQLDRRATRHRTRMELLRAAASTGRARLAALERAFKLQEQTLAETRKTLAAATNPNGDEHLLDEFYAAFESRFRGTREEIKKRQGVYVSLIQEAGAGAPEAPILDLGCGRGEWLELLGEMNLAARGADLNRVFIQENRGRGLDVVEEDVMACLRSLKPSSMGAITSFHLIEHLPFKVLIVLIDEALRVLRPGGVLILETPNPSNLQVGACNFYIDPTHRNPIPSVLASALLELRGFSNVSVKQLHPWPESEWISDGSARVDAALNRILFGPQDYGVIGWKSKG